MRPKYFPGHTITVERPSTPTMQAVIELCSEITWDVLRAGRLPSGEEFVLHRAVEGPAATRLMQLLDDPNWTRCLRAAGVDRSMKYGVPVRMVL